MVMYLFMKRHLNTSHVNVNQFNMVHIRKRRIYLNTSHVNVNQESMTDSRPL